MPQPSWKLAPRQERSYDSSGYYQLGERWGVRNDRVVDAEQSRSDPRYHPMRHFRSPDAARNARVGRAPRLRSLRAP